jgi:hypothetical protein
MGWLASWGLVKFDYRLERNVEKLGILLLHVDDMLELLSKKGDRASLFPKESLCTIYNPFSFFFNSKDAKFRPQQDLCFLPNSCSLKSRHQF